MNKEHKYFIVYVSAGYKDVVVLSTNNHKEFVKTMSTYTRGNDKVTPFFRAHLLYAGDNFNKALEHQIHANKELKKNRKWIDKTQIKNI